MEKDTISYITKIYDLGEPLEVKRVLSGVLNTNYLLTTSRGRYFIKGVREKIWPYVSVVAKVEQLMREHNIPAIGMIQTTTGQTSILYEDCVYCVYPHVLHATFNDLNTDMAFSLGENLAHIHLVGRDAHIEGIQVREYSTTLLQEKIENLQSFADMLQTKKNKSEIDHLFERSINFKLARIKSGFDSTKLPIDTVIHGDYHTGNILFDEDRKIVGICDWEKTVLTSRSFEVIRSIMYSPMKDITNIEESIKLSKDFLAGYQSVYPVDEDELRLALKVRLADMIASFWIERQYYVEHDDRANIFIQHEIDLIDLFEQRDVIAEII